MTKIPPRATLPPALRQHSVSRFKTFRGCPFAFWQTVVEKVPKLTATVLLEEGRLLHEMTAAYINHLLATLQRWDWEWAEANVPGEASFRVRQTWRGFVRRFILPAALERPLVEGRLGLDRDFNILPDFFKSPGLFFRLVLDFAFVQDGLAVVRDWKSNMIMVEDPLEDEQMLIYGYVFQKQTHADEVLLSLESLALGYKREAYALPGDLAHVPDMVHEMAARIEANKKWAPTPGSYCAMCGVSHVCPEMSQALIEREYIAPADLGDAQKLTSLLLRLDTLRGLLKGKLDAWVAENGPVQVADVIFGPVPTSTPILDPEEIARLLLEEGIPREKVWEILKITKTDLARLLKSRAVKRRDLLDRILMNAPTKDSATIKFTKIKESKEESGNGENGNE